VEQRLLTGGQGLVFGRTAARPFGSTTVVARARRAWKQAGLQPIGMHEARHACASLMIAAGLGVKTVSTYMGHSTITITLDRYSHLLPGNEREARAQLDRLLDTAADPS